MKKLDARSFERARAYLLDHGRPVDRALFLAEFEGRNGRDVLSELAAYRNSDGGFGNALEPDLRLPLSSALATATAFYFLRAVHATGDEPLVRGALDYLMARYDPERPGWRDVPAEANAHPHAPWWERADSGTLGPEDVWGNPDADIIAFFHEHAEQIPAALLETLTSLALEQLQKIPGAPPPYVSLCYLRLGAVAPGEVRAAIETRLHSDARRILDLDPATLASNHFPVWWLAESPEAWLAESLAGEIEASLDGEIERQSEQGYWEPRWSWGPAYPEAWQQALRDWRGHEALHTLQALRAYGRIEGLAP
ncbi:MAG: hypothetical protein GY723_12775 [bacterium]|nr:hypothetical protein [bacterium]MCP5067643.1 hypothetical protein [bacterium]